MEARAAQQLPAQTGRFKTLIILFSCENFRDQLPDSTQSSTVQRRWTYLRLPERRRDDDERRRELSMTGSRCTVKRGGPKRSFHFSLWLSREEGAEGARLDRSFSWIVQRAYRLQPVLFFAAERVALRDPVAARAGGCGRRGESAVIDLPLEASISRGKPIARPWGSRQDSEGTDPGFRSFPGSFLARGLLALSPCARLASSRGFWCLRLPQAAARSPAMAVGLAEPRLVRADRAEVPAVPEARREERGAVLQVDQPVVGGTAGPVREALAVKGAAPAARAAFAVLARSPTGRSSVQLTSPRRRCAHRKAPRVATRTIVSGNAGIALRKPATGSTHASRPEQAEARDRAAWGAAEQAASAVVAPAAVTAVLGEKEATPALEAKLGLVVAPGGTAAVEDRAAYPEGQTAPRRAAPDPCVSVPGHREAP
jgi:hypothetical protein